jgi:hypothetical protein
VAQKIDRRTRAAPGATRVIQKSSNSGAPVVLHAEPRRAVNGS